MTQGQGLGDLLRVLPWQKRFVQGAFSPGIMTAALSIARGAGKSTLVAAIADAFLRGPLRQPRAEVLVVASSFAQSKIIFDHVVAFLGDDRARFRVNDSANKALIECPQSGARIRCLGSDPRRLHGAAASLILSDEVAQWPHTQEEAMRSALLTTLGKLPDSRMIVIGTRPATSAHWFEHLLQGGADYSQVHSARPGDPPFQVKTWIKANPSLPYMPWLLDATRRESREAKRDPSVLQAFRALRLNLGVSDHAEALLLDADVWRRIESDGSWSSSSMSGPMVLGIDLGGTAAMSACAAYWPETGFLDTIACFPEIPDLGERGLRDGVGGEYRTMAERGELIVAGQRVPDVPALLYEALDRWGPAAVITADRYKEGELLQVLDRTSFPKCPVKWRGMGWKDGAADVRAFRSACLTDRVHPAESLLLRSSMASARVTTDVAGNQKLAKSGQGKRLNARDDAAAAAILAVAEGGRRASASAAPARRHAVVR